MPNQTLPGSSFPAAPSPSPNEVRNDTTWQVPDNSVSTYWGARSQGSFSFSPILYVVLYALIWTLVSAAFDPTVPYDAIEAINWAQNRDWGTPKNPWLVGVAMWPALGLHGTALSIYWYLAHFTAIAIGLLGVWRLALRLSNDRGLAWLAMLSLHLSGVINIDILPYNDNYLLVMLWPWMLFWFIRAAFDEPRAWPIFAVVAGMAAMSKYSTFALIGMMFLATLFVPQIRQCYRQRSFHLALAIFALFVLPNVWWLIQHDFAAFRWVGDQIVERLNTRALRGALAVFYPIAVLALMLRCVGLPLAWPSASPATLPLRTMLFVLLPPLLPILTYFTWHEGGRIAEWLQPFVVPMPALLVACVQRTSHNTLRRLAPWLLGVAVIILLGYSAALLSNVKNAGQKFAGIKTIGIVLEQRWQTRYQTPLRYVGHDSFSEWLMFYAPGHPRVLERWSSERHPNVYTRDLNDDDVVRSGALLLGRPGKTCQQVDFSETLASWPRLRIDAIEEVAFSRHGRGAPVPLCAAFIAPSTDSPTTTP